MVELNTHIIKTDAYAKIQAHIHTERETNAHTIITEPEIHTHRTRYTHTHIEPDRGATKTNTHTHAQRSKHACN